MAVGFVSLALATGDAPQNEGKEEGVGSVATDPDRAGLPLAKIEEDRLQSYTGSLAAAAIMGNPGIATAVMQSMDDHDERARATALRDSILQLEYTSHVDVFPAPGLPNRLPNFQERYECLLEAVEAGNFRPSKKVSLLRSLYANFRFKVPEAQQAFEAMTERD